MTEKRINQVLLLWPFMVIEVVTDTRKQKEGGTMGTVKGSKKTVTIWGLVAILVISAWLLVPLIRSQEVYAESNKVSGTTESVTRLAQETIRLPDMINSIGFNVSHWVLSSTDPDWDNAHVFYVRYTHPTKLMVVKGYTAITHPGGDQTFFKYEGKVEPSGGVDQIQEAKGRYIGGTGKFKGITGSWTSKLKFTQTEGITVEWETEYEVK
jgi:hypothetical protein